MIHSNQKSVCIAALVLLSASVLLSGCGNEEPSATSIQADAIQFL